MFTELLNTWTTRASLACTPRCGVLRSAFWRALVLTMLGLCSAGCGDRAGKSSSEDAAADLAADDAAEAAYAASTAARSGLRSDVAEGEAQTFHGQECTDDCRGHEAGYEWAEDKSITDPDDCGGKSASFEEGCRAWAMENG